MVRLADMHEAGRASALELECPSFDDKPFVAAGPASQRHVALISSAGLVKRGDKSFKGGDATYRSFPSAVENEDILISHISVNFDRTAALRDIETIFPRRLLSRMAADGEIASAADTHYSFMGATDPAAMEANATELAASLAQQGIDTAVFLPV